MMGVLEITSTPDVVAVKMIMKCPDLTKMCCRATV